MSKENDGGPAFPARKERYIAQELVVDYLPGMSLRDWFAGQALTGILPSTDNESGRSAFTETEPDWIAQKAYELADAMLEARNK